MLPNPFRSFVSRQSTLKKDPNQHCRIRKVEQQILRQGDALLLPPYSWLPTNLWLLMVSYSFIRRQIRDVSNNTDEAWMGLWYLLSGIVVRSLEPIIGLRRLLRNADRAEGNKHMVQTLQTHVDLVEARSTQIWKVHYLQLTLPDITSRPVILHQHFLLLNRFITSSLFAEKLVPRCQLPSKTKYMPMLQNFSLADTTLPKLLRYFRAARHTQKWSTCNAWRSARRMKTNCIS